MFMKENKLTYELVTIFNQKLHHFSLESFKYCSWSSYKLGLIRISVKTTKKYTPPMSIEKKAWKQAPKKKRRNPTLKMGFIL